MRRGVTQADALRLSRLRRLCWAALLSYEPMLAALCEFAAQDPLRSNGAITTLCTMYRRLRAGSDEPGAPRFDHDAATRRLIAAIAEADTDDQWLDRVLADLVGLQAGLGLPPGDARLADPAFVTYLTAVRASYFVLGMERRRTERGTHSLPGLPRG